jgi:putative SOS response-associated peptidase YedK
MCNLYKLNPDLKKMVQDFLDLLGENLHLEPTMFGNQPLKPYVAPRGLGIFVRPIDRANPGAGLEPVVGRWGLIPFFTKGPASSWKSSTNNCRSEEMATKPAFRTALKVNRCIIPATVFNEWTGPEKGKTKHDIYLADGRTLFMAGLWDRHAFDGEVTDSYTMLMQPAAGDDEMARFHNRQPVLLDRDGARTWLDLAADYQPILRAQPAGTLAFDPPEPTAA